MYYWTLIKYGVPLLVGLFIGGFIVNKIDNIKIHRLEADNAKYELVYESNRKAIDMLKKTLEEDNRTCMKRLKNKESTINKLKDIENLKSGAIDEENNSNTIIGVLNKLW